MNRANTASDPSQLYQTGGIVELADQIVTEGAADGATLPILLALILSRSPGPAKPTTLPSPIEIFDGFAYPGREALRKQLEQNFEIVALPHTQLGQNLREGDVLVRRAEGERAHLSVIASPKLRSYQELLAEGWKPESFAAGRYAQVVEGGLRPHNRADQFARRVTETSGLLPHDSLVLRLRQPVAYGQSVEGESSPLEPGGSGCPSDSNLSVTGFSRFSDNIRQLPEDQFVKLQRVFHNIDHSLSGAGGVTPVTQVVIIGHADKDAARESREPGFQQFISERRTLAVYFYLSCRLGEAKANRLRWKRVGHGARALAVLHPRTEAERKCNRRVEIALERSPKLLPQLDAGQSGPASVSQSSFMEYFHIALQGTPGQFEHSWVAIGKATEIAGKAVSLIEQRTRKMREQRCSEDVKDEFVPFFKDALQGAASKYSDPEVVVKKAAEIAEHARYFVQEQEKSKTDWKYATLPQPMDGDCEPDSKVPSGPTNHVVCRQHAHILNTTNSTVIAHDVEEYKKRVP
jgi:outer membrane protein OmpA-like peptidoglycan-associated protein